jgi:iron complex outermembrane receptor protein
VSRLTCREFQVWLPSRAMIWVLQALPGIPLMLPFGPAIAQDQPAPVALELPQLNVTSAGESAFGPIQGYRATRSSTATRTDTPIRDVPQGITVLPRELLDDDYAPRRDVTASIPGQAEIRPPHQAD